MKKILILGSGGLQIGQAGEFDYSGSQAIKALKEEGIYSILINPNVATIQTDPGMADATYLLPLNIESTIKVIEKEKPNGILLGFGGQTALNLGLELYDKQVLAKYNITVLGTGIESIRKTEDRELFKQALQKINIKTPKSYACHCIEDVMKAAEKIEFPIMIRSGFSLGGLGAHKVDSLEELLAMSQAALLDSSQILVEEYLLGWKEIEYEVVRDYLGNNIAVCNMENFDPMGVHTGESIVIAPSQTLNDEEYQKLRTISLKITNELEIKGECNVQLALCPNTGDYRVIEVNARLSRSSALASKATGYPLAFVATKLALNKGLHEIKNSITKTTTAFFEPALDYLVIKMPRWDLDKFEGIDCQIGAEMKSVGEVMGIGRSFGEAIQKASRMLNIGVQGLSGYYTDKHLSYKNPTLNPTNERLFEIYGSLLDGKTIDEIHMLTHIDKWFLYQLKEISDFELLLRTLPTLTARLLLQAKQFGFSDACIANIYNLSEYRIRQQRIAFSIIPCIKQIDTFAGEFPAKTNYLYLTYFGNKHDVQQSTKKPVVVLGSGPYCIGSSVEFDWCAVNALRYLRKNNHNTVLINSNPETVSTDYDESDRLYFEELSFERVSDILDFEHPGGVIVSLGGQIPNNIALSLDQHKYPILGTKCKNIDRAEDRAKFSSILNKLGIDQPSWIEVSTLDDAKNFISQVGYPVIIRPSYVLSGKAMKVITNEQELIKFMAGAMQVSSKHSVVLSKFIENAEEIEVDGISDNGQLKAMLISEHVENAGVHSGDATHIFPAQKLHGAIKKQIELITKKICEELQISGPFNIQVIIQGDDVKVIECNLRASRSFPFISKASGYNLIESAIGIFTGESIKPYYDTKPLHHVGVKSPQFSFKRLKKVDPLLGVEMSSTGEVAVLAKTLEEAFLNSWVASNQIISSKKILINVSSPTKLNLVVHLPQLIKKGWIIFATQKTYSILEEYEIPATLHNNYDSENIEQVAIMGLIIDIPNQCLGRHQPHDSNFRKAAISLGIPLISNMQLADLLLYCLATTEEGYVIQPKPLQHF